MTASHNNMLMSPEETRGGLVKLLESVYFFLPQNTSAYSWVSPQMDTSSNIFTTSSVAGSCTLVGFKLTAGPQATAPILQSCPKKTTCSSLLKTKSSSVRANKCSLPYFSKMWWTSFQALLWAQDLHMSYFLQDIYVVILQTPRYILAWSLTFFSGDLHNYFEELQLSCHFSLHRCFDLDIFCQEHSCSLGLRSFFRKISSLNVLLACEES